MNTSTNSEVLVAATVARHQMTRKLLSPNDGPVTAFVVIARATNLKGLDSDMVANALYDALNEGGFLRGEYDDIEGTEDMVVQYLTHGTTKDLP